jgi:hypothetical protein
VREAIDLVKEYESNFPIQEIFRHFNKVSGYLSTTIATTISIATGTIQCVE